MIEDDGGFMRRETKRDSIPEDDYCDFCSNLIDDECEKTWDDESGCLFCSPECYEEYRDDQRLWLECNKFELDAYGYPD
jgi:hypothetical protein